MREVGTPFQAWRPSLRRSGRTLVLLALVVVAVLTMVLAGVAHARRAPAWWSVDVPTAVMAEQAESFEHAVLAQMTLVRATEESWSVALSEADINAWLATRLKPWMENRGLADELPAGSVVRVRVEDGAVLVGMESRGEVVWARMSVEVEGARLMLRPEEAGVGRLAVPSSALEGRLPAAARRFVKDGLMVKGIEVDARRVVAIETVEARAGELVVKARTQVE